MIRSQGLSERECWQSQLQRGLITQDRYDEEMKRLDRIETNIENLQICPEVAELLQKNKPVSDYSGKAKHKSGLRFIASTMALMQKRAEMGQNVSGTRVN
jgi:hypothetical protein